MSGIAYSHSGDPEVARGTYPGLRRSLQSKNANPAAPIDMHGCPRPHAHLRRDICCQIAPSEFIPVLKRPHESVGFDTAKLCIRQMIRYRFGTFRVAATRQQNLDRTGTGLSDRHRHTILGQTKLAQA
jgi:hypothetical protein